MKHLFRHLKALFPPPEGFQVNGSNNRVVIVSYDGNEKELKRPIEGLKIVIRGSHNIIKIHQPIHHFQNTFLEIGNDNVFVEIKANCHISHMHMRLCFGNAQQLTIGANTTLYGGAIVLDENSQCHIGNNCLCAGGLEIWASDGHAIFDKNSKALLNKAYKPIIIEDHCWFGLAVTVLKHTHVLANSVVGSRSVLCKEYTESNVVIAGSPGKIVKHNINWTGISPLAYEAQHETDKTPVFKSRCGKET